MTATRLIVAFQSGTLAPQKRTFVHVDESDMRAVS